MKGIEIALAAVLYVIAAVRYGMAGNPGMAIAFAAYALANVGLIWAAR